jgi:tetratricopeptide (TPR) repeat protein
MVAPTSSIQFGDWALDKHVSAPQVLLRFFQNKSTLSEVLKFLETHTAMGTFLPEVCSFLSPDATRAEESIICWTRHLEQHADDVTALFNRALAFKLRQQHDLVVQELKKILTLDPVHLGALNNLGTALQAKGHVDESLQLYESALKARPDHLDALSNKAVALHTMQRLPEALEAYVSALALRPSSARVRSNYAITLMALGQQEQAIQNCITSLESSPHETHAACKQWIEQVERQRQQHNSQQQRDLQPAAALAAAQVRINAFCRRVPFCCYSHASLAEEKNNQ